MKKLTFLFFLMSLISMPVFANQQVPGIVIYENETIHVTFDVPTISFTKEWDFSRLQSKAYFHDKDGNKRLVKPTEAKEIQLFIESIDTVRLVSVIYRGKKGRGFARLIREGKINVYAMDISPSNWDNANPANYSTGSWRHGNQDYRGFMMVQKVNAGPDTKAERLFRQKDMIEFFKDCPEVIKEIEEQNLTNTELPVVVDFYFQFCGDE